MNTYIYYFKIKNEIFQQIFNMYEKDLEYIYKEESACLLIFRILPKFCQNAIIRLINLDNQLEFKLSTIITNINWADISENHSAEMKEAIRILFSIKIISSVDPKEDRFILNQYFKVNMLNLIKKGIKHKAIVSSRNKNLSWQDCYDNGISALEKYLVGIYDLDNLNLTTDNDKLKYLVNSGFITKEGLNLKLTQYAITTLLADRQLQIRYLICKYIYANKSEDGLKFLAFLFSLCTLDIGVVKYFINK
jgi:hypothetical protein